MTKSTLPSDYLQILAESRIVLLRYRAELLRNAALSAQDLPTVHEAMTKAADTLESVADWLAEGMPADERSVSRMA